MRGLATLTLLALSVPAAADRGRIGGVQRWAYQLQGELPRPSAADDCLVMDPGGDGDRATVSAAQVQRLKERAGRSPRIVLAYLSIGEAENYRAYWQHAWKRHPPPFLAGENPRWPGNFKVRYWQPEWQAIVMRALDHVIDAGFDGAYLDIIDAFEYFGPGGPRPERESAAEDMARFVGLLAEHARRVRGRPDFLIVPQNGATILEKLSPDGARAYLSAIDAIGAEDAFFSGRLDENNPLRPDKEMLAALARFRDAGKKVLSVEYVTLHAKVREYLRLAAQHGFAPCVAPRELDRLIEPKE